MSNNDENGVVELECNICGKRWPQLKNETPDECPQCGGTDSREIGPA